MYEVIRKNAAKVSAGLFSLGVAASSFAAVGDDPFTAAVTDATTKIGGYGAALVGVSAIGVGFMIAMKYVKKIRGAA